MSDTSEPQNNRGDRQQGNQPENNRANESANNHKNPYYDWLIARIEPYLPPPVAEGSETAKRRKHFEAHQKLFLEIAGFAFVIIGFIVAFGQLGILIWQLSEMHSQSAAFQGQLDEMRQTTKLDERAWIYPQIVDNSLVLQGTNLTFYVLVKNTSKTTALVTGAVARAALDLNQIPKFDDENHGVNLVLTPENAWKLSMPVPPLVISYTGSNPIYIFGTV